jgi:putative two-component system response regulator
LKASEATRLIPVVLLTDLDDRESKIKGIESDADDFITKPPNKMELLARTKSLIKLKRLNDKLASIENVLFSLAKTVEAKDEYTQGHVERVSKLAIALGKKMGLSEREMEALRYGGILHDIGKIGIPGDILNKPGPLNDGEWEVMKNHPVAGYNICLPLKKNLGAALEVIRHHHEKLDGSGYPDGIKNEEISTAARIMAVVDIYDALVTDRPYRKGMPLEKAVEILKQEASNQKLDPAVVKYLIEFVGDVHQVDTTENQDEVSI